MTASSMRRRRVSQVIRERALALWREESAQPVSVKPPQDLMDLEEIGALDGYGVWAAFTARYRLEVEGAQGASREERLKELWHHEATKARGYQAVHDENGLFRSVRTQFPHCPGTESWFKEIFIANPSMRRRFEEWQATAPECHFERDHLYTLLTTTPSPHPLSKVPNTAQEKAFLIWREVSRYNNPQVALTIVERFLKEHGGRHHGFKKNKSGEWEKDSRYHRLRERAIELHHQGYGYERIAKTLKRESPNAPTRNTIRKYIEQERLTLTHLAKEEEQLDNNKEKSHETVDPE